MTQQSSSQECLFTRADFDDCLNRFDTAWHDGEKPEIIEYRPPAGAAFEPGIDRLELLSELIMVDMEYRWRRAGSRPRVDTLGAMPEGDTLPDEIRLADYLRRFPELGDYEDLPAGVIANEYRVRQRWGDRPSHDSYLDQFPRRVDELKSAFNSVDSRLSPERPRADFRVRCPSCHRPIDVARDAVQQDISCPACHVAFRLFGDEMNRDEANRDGPAECQTIAHFELLERVGVGTFGTVWRARDTKLDRIVALKTPRSNTIGPAEAEQFLSEARAAAQLRHPHIVSVHEAGRDEKSVYIVSDFIDGVSLDEQLQSERMTQRQAAEFCAKVADALHHAHEHGVIHRDLKPGNIMLDAADEPRIMDFGLAKRDAGEILMTLEGKLLGTPAYMSPEQARGEAHRADRRTDVYSLGVILFELLTGELPFRGNTRMLLHQVLHDDAPSLRKLDNSITRDLETICLKCLEKEPAKRYATAALVAEELQRTLRGQPIAARPIPRSARGWRLCKRNPLVTALSLLVTLALIAGTAFSTYFAVIAADRAEEKEILAEQEKAARGEADEAKDVAIGELDKRRQAQQQIDEALRKYVDILSRSELLKDGRHQPLIRQLLSHAQVFFEQNIELNRDKPDKQLEVARLLQMTGKICTQIGDIRQAISMYEEALRILQHAKTENPGDLELHVDVAKIHLNLGRSKDSVGDSAKAMQHLKTALEIFRPLARNHPTNLLYQSYVPVTYNSIAAIEVNDGDLPSALSHVQRATETHQEIVKKNPFDADQRDSLARSYLNLSLMQVAHDDRAAALRSVIRAIENGEKLVADSPNQIEYQDTLSGAYAELGKHQRWANNRRAAVGTFTKAIKLRKVTVRKDPHVASYGFNLAALYRDLGRTTKELNDFPGAIVIFRLAIGIYVRLADENPGVRRYREQLSLSYNDIAKAQVRIGETKAAFESIRKAIDIHEQLVRDDESRIAYRNRLAGNYRLLGVFQQESGDPRAACVNHEQAIHISEGLIRENHATAAIREGLAMAYNNLALAQSEIAQPEKALSNYAKAGAIQVALAQQFPSREHYRALQAGTHSNMGKLHFQIGNPEAAEQSIEKAVNIQQELVDDIPQVTEYQRLLTACLNNLGMVKLKRGDLTGAVVDYEKSLAILAPLVKSQPKLVKQRVRLSRTVHDLAESYTKLKQFDKAFAALDVLFELTPPSRQGAARFWRADVLARSGKHSLAAAELDDILPFAKEPSDRFDFARVYAICADAAQNDKTMSEALREVTRDEYVRRASVIIAQLSAKGFFDDAKLLAKLRDSPDFAPLREQPEIRKLLKE